MYHPKETKKVIGEQGTKVLRLFRSAVSFHASSVRPVKEEEEKPETYAAATRRMNEIETQKAFVRAVSNSDKWKAGGAY